MSRRYGTAYAFRTALEERLAQISRAQGLDVMRLRRLIAFERLLARLFTHDNPPWLLKGGYSLELRLGTVARATKDIDIALPIPSLIIGPGPDRLRDVRERIQSELEQDLDDWFVFIIGAPIMDIVAAPYGGARFPVEARLAGRIFSQFHLDVALGDALTSLPDWITGHDMLGFAGIPPARIAVLPLAQQFAEKIHAYTLPRDHGFNTRVKALVDLVLLLQLGLPDRQQVVHSIQATFARRQTHEIPPSLAAPPVIWEAPYRALAASCGVSKPTLREAFEYVSQYWIRLEPLLSDEHLA